MNTRYKLFFFIFLFFCAGLFYTQPAFSQSGKNESSTAIPVKLTLTKHAMCAGVKDYSPVNQSVVFSIGIGKVSCFTTFDPVPEKTYIYHKWFHRDKLSTKKRLFLNPPRWSTYSSIQLRETDKGPWRVEITDRKGNILGILRFSITD